MPKDFTEYKYQDNIPKSVKIKRLIWNCVWLFLFRPTPRFCLNSWRIFLLKLFGAKIGKGCRVLPSCFVWAPWNLEMGNLSVLAENVDCYSMGKIIIGSKVAISQRSFLCTGSHDYKSLITEPIYINDHVWICAESMIMPGVTINEGVVVAARSLVTKNLAPWKIYAGNPAKIIKNRDIKND